MQDARSDRVGEALGGGGFADGQRRQHVDLVAPGRPGAALGADELGEALRVDRGHRGQVHVRCPGVGGGEVAVPVHTERVGPELDQQLDHVRPATVDREVQRQAMVLVAAHPAVQRRRILGDDRPHAVFQAEREGGEHVVARAAAHEELGDLGLRGLPARRPADHAERVVVAVSVHVAAGVHQQADDLEMAGRGRPVQRAGVVFRLTRVDIGTVAQKRLDGAGVAGLGRLEQGHEG
jgi:hypothetical protein